ncbi:unnamed protein product [Linum trigynum]|uniref:Uncharacterized protein n=1 Tax=Linum trigynum TaxID=586398 RepID=A0AAV2DB18_9ROSI
MVWSSFDRKTVLTRDWNGDTEFVVGVWADSSRCSIGKGEGEGEGADFSSGRPRAGISTGRSAALELKRRSMEVGRQSLEENWKMEMMVSSRGRGHHLSRAAP